MSNFNFGSGGESTGFSFGGGDSTSGGGTAAFSFGGGDSKKEEKKTETSSNGTFSFGGTDEKKTDSSTPSFSFGGGNDAVSFGSGKKTHALEDDKKESSKKKGLTLDLGNSETKSETGGSFSFGGTTEEKKTETSSLGGGGFGFGVSDSTETKKETNFSFSGTSSDQKKEENSTSVEPKGILSKPTSEMFNLKNKTVEDIINKWNIELEEDVSLFTKLAIQAAKWDKELLTNEEKVKKKKKKFLFTN